MASTSHISPGENYRGLVIFTLNTHFQIWSLFNVNETHNISQWLAAIASYSVRRHVVPLCFGDPKFESQLGDLSQSQSSISPLLCFLSNYCPIEIKPYKCQIIVFHDENLLVPSHCIWSASLWCRHFSPRSFSRIHSLWRAADPELP